MFREECFGAAPHFVAQDVAGVGFDEVAELVFRVLRFVGAADGGKCVTDKLDWAAAVGFTEV